MTDQYSALSANKIKEEVSEVISALKVLDLIKKKVSTTTSLAVNNEIPRVPSYEYVQSIKASRISKVICSSEKTSKNVNAV